MGSFIGGLLSRRHKVLLIGRAEHVDAIREQGLRITGKTAMIAKPEAATTVPQRARPDFVFVTTKAYDTANAMGPLERSRDGPGLAQCQTDLGMRETSAKTAQGWSAGPP